MPLIASCDALYFPDVALDNAITFRWVDDAALENGDADKAEAGAASPATATPPAGADAKEEASAPSATLEPNSTVIFKIKSTSPHLFHVRPHYGALLLCDAAAIAAPASFQSLTVQFGLRSNYASNGGQQNDNGTVATRHTAPYSGSSRGSPSPARRGQHQERFVVDYVVLKNEPVAYRQVAQSFHNPTKLVEAVKGIWTLLSSNTVSSSHVGLRGSINLNAFTEKVYRTAPEALGVRDAVIVPANARLVPCSMGDRAGSARSAQASVTTPTAGANNNNNSSSSNSVGVRGSPSKRSDELRALKEEITHLRQEVRSPETSRNTTPSNTVRGLSPQLSNTGTPDLRSAQRGAAAGDNGDDILMRFNPDEAGAGKKKKGLKLYLLLVIMFVVYALTMWMRKGPAPRLASASVSVEDGGAAEALPSDAAAPAGDL